MRKLPFIILLAALSGLHLTACAEEDAAKQETTAEAKPAEGEQITTQTDETKPAQGDEKKTGGDGEEPDCN